MTYSYHCKRPLEKGDCLVYSRMFKLLHLVQFTCICLFVSPRFQCEDEEDLRSWFTALEKAIQLALGDWTVISQFLQNQACKNKIFI